MDSTPTKTLLFSLLLVFAWHALPVSAGPKDVVLVLDNSAGMKTNDPEFLTRLAVRNFFERVGEESRVALLLFDKEVRLVMPLTPLDDAARGEFLRSLDRLDYQGLYADTPAAIERAIHELKVNGRSEADRSVVFITEGVVDSGDPAMDAVKSERLRNDLAAEAAEHGIRIFAVAFTDTDDSLFIRSLSKRTSGEYFRAFSGADIEGVFQRITRVLARTQPPAAAAAWSGAGRRGKAPAFTTPPEPALLPQLELLEAAPIFDDPLGSPGSAGAEKSDETATLPALEVIGAADTAMLPTLPKDEMGVDTSVDSEPTGKPIQAGEPAGTPAATSNSGKTGAPERLKKISAAAAEESEQVGVFVPSAWLGFLLATGMAGIVLITGMTLFLRRRSVDKTMLEDELPKAFLNDLGGVTDKPSYELGESLTVVGRIGGSDADRINYVVIPEPTVGRRHALIEFKNHCFWVADQNSLNGTFINDKRIEGDTRLKHGDRIRFHKHEFEFLLLDMFETDRTKMCRTVPGNFSRAVDGGYRIQPLREKGSNKATFTAGGN